jgi:hypothetical protein
MGQASDVVRRFVIRAIHWRVMGWWSSARGRRGVHSSSGSVRFTNWSGGGTSLKPIVTDFVVIRTVILLRHFRVRSVAALMRKAALDAEEAGPMLGEHCA